MSNRKTIFRRGDFYRKEFQHLFEFERLRIVEPEFVRMRLQRNEKPEPWPEKIQNEIYSSMPEGVFNLYPDPIAFYRLAADHFGVSLNQVLVASGIDESIRSLLALTCKAGDSIVGVEPGYAMYPVYAKIYCLNFKSVSYHPEKFTGSEGFARKIDNKTRIVFVPTPSVPIENCFPLEELQRLAAICEEKRILLVIDEAYHYFGAPSAIRLLQEYDNILIFRTLSKVFGAAGIRLGFVIGNERSLAPLAAYRLAHEINGLSLHVGTKLLENFDTWVSESIRQTCKGRDFLKKSLSALGFPTAGGKGNTLRVNLLETETAERVVYGLRKRGIYTKGGFGKPIENQIIITCGSESLMRGFLAEFQEIIK